MCNTMASILIILISIASIATITGEAVKIDSDKDWNNAHIDKLSETLSRQNLQTLIVPNYHGLDVWTILQLRPRLDPLQTLSRSTETTRKNRRQIDGKIIGEDGGPRPPSSVTSLASYSSPSSVNGKIYLVSVENLMNQIQKPGLGHRRRRLASGSELSSNKNTKASADPALPNDGHNMSAFKCLLSLSYPVSLPTQCIQFYFRSLFKVIH